MAIRPDLPSSTEFLQDGPPCSARASGQTARDEIERVLNSPTEIDVHQVPLADVIEQLREQHGVEFQLDRAALDEIGVATDTPVAKRLKGISLKSMLRHLPRDLDLTYVVQDEVILITSVDAARQLQKSGN